MQNYLLFALSLTPLSPIDFIPDFIPLLGYLDDVVLVPLGVMLALKMIPIPVIAECSVEAEALMMKGKPKNWFAGSIIILVWMAVVIWISFITFNYFIG